MSDSEILTLRVRVQQAMASLQRPRNERDEGQVVAALEEISAALLQLQLR
ncbi:MAG: hypothetical protein ACI970_000032 [Myxococcota bacterium]|jgi:hypothetical protein